MKDLTLRDFQLLSVDGLRAGFLARHIHQLLCSATGSGKSIMAVYLVQQALAKGTRTAFVVDRISLIDQISRTFSEYGIEHGVIQADHPRFRPWERVQVISAPTLARRDLTHLDPFQLLIFDECHIHNKAVLDLMAKHPAMKVVGLTATPFSKNLGAIFSNIVNVTTTNQLVADGWLAPLKVYAARAIDMRGAKPNFDGEWKATDIEQRGQVIIGDIVSGWIDKTTKHFGGPVKTIMFSATVAHGEELCRQFQAAGVNLQQVSYRDGNDDSRRALIEEFRKPDSEIMGLVSCEALGRGFDVPDIKCIVAARPYRKSLSSWVQQLGRGMRPYPDKDFCLVNDHSGNWLRFEADLMDFFEHGVQSLDNAELDAKVRKEPEPKASSNACRSCGYIMLPADDSCPSCGTARPRRKNEHEAVPGELVEVNGRRHAKAPQPGERLAWMEDTDQVMSEILDYALERKGGDMEAAIKFALAQYRSMYGEWPKRKFSEIAPHPYSSHVAGKIRRQLLKYWKTMKEQKHGPEGTEPRPLA